MPWVPILGLSYTTWYPYAPLHATCAYPLISCTLNSLQGSENEQERTREREREIERERERETGRERLKERCR